MSKQWRVYIKDLFTTRWLTYTFCNVVLAECPLVPRNVELSSVSFRLANHYECMPQIVKLNLSIKLKYSFFHYLKRYKYNSTFRVKVFEALNSIYIFPRSERPIKYIFVWFLLHYQPWRRLKTRYKLEARTSRIILYNYCTTMHVNCISPPRIDLNYQQLLPNIALILEL